MPRQPEASYVRVWPAVQACTSVLRLCAGWCSAWGYPAKRPFQATERDTPRIQQARADYRQLMATLDVRLLPRMDESGVNLAMTRLYGRALRGTRGIGSIPQNDGQNVTRLGTLGAQGLQAVMTVDSATDAEVFQTYVKRVLRPTLQPGDMVVMDKLRAHQAVGVQQALACRGARLVCLSPREPCCSKVTIAPRTAEARTCDALDTALTHALLTVTGTDAHG